MMKSLFLIIVIAINSNALPLSSYSDCSIFASAGENEELKINIPENPNKLNRKGKRQGKWTILYDLGWREVQNKELAVYYRIITFRNGKPVGEVKNYTMDGKPYWTGSLKSTNPDIFNGIIKFYKKGILDKEIEYHDKVKHGKWIKYYEDGKIRSRGNFTNGERSGIWTSFYQSGQKKRSGKYIAGERDSIWTSWNKKGAPVKYDYFFRNTLLDPYNFVNELDAMLLTGRADYSGRYLDLLKKYYKAERTGDTRLQTNILLSEIKILDYYRLYADAELLINNNSELIKNKYISDTTFFVNFIPYHLKIKSVMEKHDEIDSIISLIYGDTGLDNSIQQKDTTLKKSSKMLDMSRVARIIRWYDLYNKIALNLYNSNAIENSIERLMVFSIEKQNELFQNIGKSPKTTFRYIQYINAPEYRAYIDYLLYKNDYKTALSLVNHMITGFILSNKSRNDNKQSISNENNELTDFLILQFVSLPKLYLLKSELAAKLQQIDTATAAVNSAYSSISGSSAKDIIIRMEYLKFHHKYHKKKNINKAEKYLKSIEIFNDKSYYYAKALKIVGDMYAEENQYKKARAFYNNAIETYKTALCENHTQVASIHESIADTYIDEKDIDSAVSYLEKALEIYKSKNLQKTHKINNYKKITRRLYQSYPDNIKVINLLMK